MEWEGNCHESIQPSNESKNCCEIIFFSFVRSYVRLLSANETSSQIEIAFFTPCERKTLAIKIKMFVKPFFWKNVIILLLLLKCKMYRWRLKNIWESRFVSMRTILKKGKKNFFECWKTFYTGYFKINNHFKYRIL